MFLGPPPHFELLVSSPSPPPPHFQSSGRYLYDFVKDNKESKYKELKYLAKKNVSKNDLEVEVNLFVLPLSGTKLFTGNLYVESRKQK